MRRQRFFPPPGYVSIPQAAIQLASGETTVYKWIDEGKIKAEEFQRYEMSDTMAKAISEEELERYMAAIRQRFGTRTYPEHEPRPKNPIPRKDRIPQRAAEDLNYFNQ